jgi:hypothetical protein
MNGTDTGLADNTLPLLIGVAVGWSLGEGTRLLRGRRCRERFPAALRAECETILAQIPQVLDVIAQVRQQLAMKQILPAGHVHSPRAAYEAAVNASWHGRSQALRRGTWAAPERRTG